MFMKIYILWNVAKTNLYGTQIQVNNSIFYFADNQIKKDV